MEKEESLIKVINSAKNIRCISHLDADGLCSAGLIARLLLKHNKRFHLTIIKQLEADIIEDFKKESYDTYIFTDLGSGQLSSLKELLQKSKVIIIDHHHTDIDETNENLIHLNANLLGFNGDSEVSASTLTYFVCKMLGIEGTEHLAVVGSIGDNQETSGQLTGLNATIFNEKDNITVKKGLRIFGRISKPLHQALAYSSDAIIPGVTGDESLAIQFLSELGIQLKNENGWRNLADLSEDEEKVITSQILMRRLNKTDNPQDIFSNVYTFQNKEDLLSDGREFATILNACGRQGMASVGLMLTMGENKDALDMAKSLLNSYKRRLLNAMNSVKKGENAIRTSQALYIMGGSDIDDTMIGTICSMLSASNAGANFVVGFADSMNGVKVSARAHAETNFDVNEALSAISKELGGEGGGHKFAAGAKIPMGKEKEFIDRFEQMVNIIKAQKVADIT